MACRPPPPRSLFPKDLTEAYEYSIETIYNTSRKQHHLQRSSSDCTDTHAIWWERRIGTSQCALFLFGKQIYKEGEQVYGRVANLVKCIIDLCLQYPLSEMMMKPASDPEYYGRLVKELNEAPTRSWLQSKIQKWKGAFRFKWSIYIIKSIERILLDYWWSR